MGMPPLSEKVACQCPQTHDGRGVECGKFPIRVTTESCRVDEVTSLPNGSLWFTSGAGLKLGGGLALLSPDSGQASHWSG